jgi:hypothetical protein
MIVCKGGFAIVLIIKAIEELLEWKSSGSRLENEINGRENSLHWPRNTLYPQRLALIFLIGIVGGWNPNWIHSALRPPIGLLFQPRVIVMMEKLVEWWLAGETEVVGEKLLHCHFVHHKPQMPARTRTRAAAVGSQRLTAWTTAQQGWH